MKKALLIFLLGFGYVAGQAQVSVKDKAITFYGLDFSKARMVGTEGFSNPNDIVNRIFGEWNGLIVSEPDKYDVKSAFNKTEVTNDFSIVEKRNKAVKPDELVTNNSYSFDEKTVDGIVRAYSSSNKGLGIVLVVEKFDKGQELASLFVTYFDAGSKKVLLTERVTAQPVGFGFRNYWAGAIAKILKDCHKQSPKWEAGAN